MKILHVIDYYQEQLGYQESHLAKEHTHGGHDVLVVTSNKFYPFKDYDALYKPVLGERLLLSSEILFQGYKIVRNNTLFEVKNRVWIRQLIRTIESFEPDVIICHGLVNFTFFRILFSTSKTVSNARLIVDDHMANDFISNKNLSWLFYKFFRLFFSGIIEKKADKIVAVSEVTKQFMISNYGFRSSNISLIPLGTDLNVFHPSDEIRLEMRQKYNIAKDDIVLVYSGKIVPEKKIEFTINALSKLPIDFRNRCHLILIGTFKSEYLKTLIKLCDSNFNLIIEPFQKDPFSLASFYKMSDVGVWPFGASAGTIDCLACGNVVVCSDYLPERVSNQNGILISANDSTEKLTTFLIDLFTKKGKLLLMKHNSAELAKRDFSWNAIAQIFLN